MYCLRSELVFRILSTLLFPFCRPPPGTAPPIPSPKQRSTSAQHTSPSPLLGGLGSPPKHSDLLSQSIGGGEGGSSDDQQQKSADLYGLRGLLNVIRMTDPDLNTLALGSDLTTLGLNLNSTECLYTTFASPWAEGPTTRDPKFFLPQCYNIQKQSEFLAACTLVDVPAMCVYICFVVP